jgi:hypothetical protein
VRTLLISKPSWEYKVTSTNGLGKIIDLTIGDKMNVKRNIAMRTLMFR